MQCKFHFYFIHPLGFTFDTYEANLTTFSGVTAGVLVHLFKKDSFEDSKNQIKDLNKFIGNNHCNACN